MEHEWCEPESYKRAVMEKVVTTPLLDLKAQYKTIKEEIQEAINRVLESQYFILGPEVEALELDLAKYCGSKHAVGVSSGTDALLLALNGLDIGPGDEVITTPFTFFATAGAILRVGATPVLVDIRPDTFNIDETKIKAAITKKTKAIEPVHLFGQIAEMEPILNIAEQYGLFVIEDAAQAIGAGAKDKPAGGIGTAGCFSFFPSKNLGAYGEGGLITVNDSALAEKLRILRNQGAHPKYCHKQLGGNFRLDAIQAAVLRVKFKRLEQWTEDRRANAAYYTRALEAADLGGKVQAPLIIRERHVFNQFVIRCEDRDALKNYLAEHAITTEIYYPLPMHFQECFKSHNFGPGSLPIAEEACKNVLALPIYPELTDAQQQYVIDKIVDFYGA